MAWRDSHSIGECCRKCHEKGGDYTACHDTCPTYQKARAEREKWRETVRKNKEKQRIIDNRMRRK